MGGQEAENYLQPLRSSPVLQDLLRGIENKKPPLSNQNEPLLRSLKLWEFANLRLDSDIRTDLVAELVANYNPHDRCSLVGGLLFDLSPAALGSVLFLPSSDGRGSTDFDANDFGGADAVVTVLSEFVSKMMVLSGEDAADVAEMAATTKVVNGGRPHTVDWAGLMWAMVERELLEGRLMMPASAKEEILGAMMKRRCRYAPHLQRLLRCQRPELFEQGEKPGPKWLSLAVGGDADGSGPIDTERRAFGNKRRRENHHVMDTEGSEHGHSQKGRMIDNGIGGTQKLEERVAEEGRDDRVSKRAFDGGDAKEGDGCHLVQAFEKFAFAEYIRKKFPAGNNSDQNHG